MTPEQIAEQLINEMCCSDKMWRTHGMPPEHKLAILQDAIATALRTARNEALEEAKRYALSERGNGDSYPPFWNVCCSKIAGHIEALKHKDGQP